MEASGRMDTGLSMVAGSCPSMALAEEADQQIVDVEEFSDQEQAGEVSQAEEHAFWGKHL